MGVKGSVAGVKKIEAKVSGNWMGTRAGKFLKVWIPRV